MQQLYLKNLLWRLEHSLGSEVYRRSYWLESGEEIDILNNGELSCATFVSNILLGLSLEFCKMPRATVKNCVADLIECGWEEVPLSEAKTGAILVWEEKEGHKHIGFYINRDEAISNSAVKGVPEKHDLLPAGRQIEKVFVHPFLV